MTGTSFLKARAEFLQGSLELVWILRAQCKSNRAEEEANYSPVHANCTYVNTSRNAAPGCQLGRGLASPSAQGGSGGWQGSDPRAVARTLMTDAGPWEGKGRGAPAAQTGGEQRWGALEPGACCRLRWGEAGS